MSEHITNNEFRQYFDILLSGTLDEDDADFVNDIDAHLAECDQCFEKMQAIRLLMQGFSSNRNLAKTFINTEFPETLARPAFDIKTVFMGVKLNIKKTVVQGNPFLSRLESKCGEEITQILADTVSDKMNAIFVPHRNVLAAVRGDDEIGIDGSAINDLLCSDMEFLLEGGRKITIRCRNQSFTNKNRLYIYSNFEINFKLASDGKVLEPAEKDHDIVTNEYILVYEFDDGDEFLLTVE